MFPQINVVDFGSVHINDRATRKVTWVGIGWNLGLLYCVIDPHDRRLKLTMKLTLKSMIFSCGWYFWVGWGFCPPDLNNQPRQVQRGLLVALASSSGPRAESFGSQEGVKI